MRSSITKFLPKGNVRDVAILSGGTAVAQIISVSVAPILTRLYKPEDFGLVVIFTGFLAIISTNSSLRYDLAIPLPKKNTHAAALVTLCLVSVCSVSVLTSIVLLFYGKTICIALNAARLIPYLWLFPVGIILTGTYQIFNLWTIRTKKFKILAQTKVIQSSSSALIQVLGYTFGPVALLLGQITNQAVGAARLAQSAHQHRVDFYKGISCKQVLSQARRYKRFPLYSTMAGLFNIIGTQLPPILFATLFSTSAAGFYVLANRVLSLPMILVGQAVGQVFYSIAVEAKRNNRLGNLISEIHNKLAQIAMPPALLILFTAPELFILVFGQEWRQAGIFVQLLTPMLYFQFILSPISQTFSIMERQKLAMFLQGIMMLIRVLALLLGSFFGDVLLAVFLFSIASSIGYILFLIVTVHITNIAWPDIILPTINASLWGIFTISPTVLTYALPIHNTLCLLFLHSITLILVSSRCLSLIKFNIINFKK